MRYTQRSKFLIPTSHTQPWYIIWSIVIRRRWFLYPPIGSAANLQKGRSKSPLDPKHSINIFLFCQISYSKSQKKLQNLIPSVYQPTILFKTHLDHGIATVHLRFDSLLEKKLYDLRVTYSFYATVRVIKNTTAQSWLGSQYAGLSHQNQGGAYQPNSNNNKRNSETTKNGVRSTSRNVVKKTSFKLGHAFSNRYRLVVHKYCKKRSLRYLTHCSKAIAWYEIARIRHVYFTKGKHTTSCILQEL